MLLVVFTTIPWLSYENTRPSSVLKAWSLGACVEVLVGSTTPHTALIKKQSSSLLCQEDLKEGGTRETGERGVNHLPAQAGQLNQPWISE